MVVVVQHPEAVPIAHQNLWLESPDGGFGPGLDGGEQIVFTENRRWIGEIELPNLTLQQSMAARAFGDRLRGRANVWRLPITNTGTAIFTGDLAEYWTLIGVPPEDIARGFVSFDGGATFGDGSGFSLPESAEPTVIETVAAGASAALLAGVMGRHLAVGAFFADSSDYLYRVSENDGGAITFNPPARAAMAADSVIRVSAPFVQVRLADARDFRLMQEYCRHGRGLKVQVVERLER